jgi:hypothetical protein
MDEHLMEFGRMAANLRVRRLDRSTAFVGNLGLLSGFERAKHASW